MALILKVVINKVTSGHAAGLQISNTSGPALMSLKRLSNIDKLCDRNTSISYRHE